MDIVAMVVRILSSVDKAVLQLFPLGCDTLELACRASLEHCPDELSKHFHTLRTSGFTHNVRSEPSSYMLHREKVYTLEL